MTFSNSVWLKMEKQDKIAPSNSISLEMIKRDKIAFLQILTVFGDSNCSLLDEDIT